MDNIISLDEHFIAGLSDNFTAKLHSHPVLEIYSSCECNSHVITEDQIIEGQIIVIGTQLSHAIADEGKYGLAVFIDPLSETGYSIMQNVLADNQFIKKILPPNILWRTIFILHELIIINLCN